MSIPNFISISEKQLDELLESLAKTTNKMWGVDLKTGEILDKYKCEEVGVVNQLERKIIQLMKYYYQLSSYNSFIAYADSYAVDSEETNDRFNTAVKYRILFDLAKSLLKLSFKERLGKWYDVLVFFDDDGRLYVTSEFEVKANKDIFHFFI